MKYPMSALARTMAFAAMNGLHQQGARDAAIINAKQLESRLYPALANTLQEFLDHRPQGLGHGLKRPQLCNVLYPANLSGRHGQFNNRQDGFDTITTIQNDIEHDWLLPMITAYGGEP